jgi:KaiC/GvpD/RAD55 family RecA-like ATPase
VPKAIELLEQPDGENGALILLRTVKDNFDDFLAIFEENVRLMRRYPLRLIAVDPVSAMTQMDVDTTKRRAKLLRMFENVKQMGTNIWLVAEENAYAHEPLYEHNIADTVIHLDVQNQHGYAQRYIEITKSRLQRELRGRHAFGLGPGTGMTVYPSSAAVKSMIGRRTNRVPEDRTRFGIPSLDDVLGPKEPGLYAGDIVGIEGPSGCAKTPLGMMFLLSPDLSDSDHAGRARSAPRALFVSTRHSEGAIRHLLDKIYALRRRMAPGAKQIPEIIVVIIEGGYVKPGYILQRIEDEFVKAKLNNYSIGRVMIDDVSHWEFAPYVRADEIFGETLLDLLRAHRVTALINCGELRPAADSPLRRLMVEGVDCLIQCERVEFRGSSRVMLRVLKTRDMGHRREYFELDTSQQTLDLKFTSPLLRVGRNGAISPVPIRLFLHEESEAQSAYNATIVTSIRSVVSRDVEIEAKMLHLGKALGLGGASAIDELQVVQLDEFQLPTHQNRGDDANPLCLFPLKSFEEGKWADTLPRLRSRAVGGDNVAGVPYFVNVGLLASRPGVDPECRTSWERLAVACQAWEREHGSELFFDFWDETEENLNCVFLEILLSLAGPPAGRDAAPRSSSTCLRQWITSELAATAMVLMHRLCSRAYRARRAGGRQLGDRRTNPWLQPRVWRQWYTTLNQTLSEMPADERPSITITPLPGGVSVAGEWYLGVPAYAAAPEVGQRIIQLFTGPDAELERFRLGVGLPTRVGFYALHESSMVGVSPYFTMDGSTLRAIVENAFPRSTFGCYSDVNTILSSHLQGVLELPAQEERTLAIEIARQCDGLRRRLESNAVRPCSFCVATPARPATLTAGLREGVSL